LVLDFCGSIQTLFNVGHGGFRRKSFAGVEDVQRFLKLHEFSRFPAMIVPSQGG
jgi:hypothetical protein